MSASAGLRQRAAAAVDVEILDKRAPSDAGSSDSENDYLTEQERNTPGFTPPTFTMKEVSTRLFLSDCRFGLVGGPCWAVDWRGATCSSRKRRAHPRVISTNPSGPSAHPRHAANHRPPPSQILAAIPKHCFERNAWHAGAYAVWDFIMLGALGYGMYSLEPFVGSNGSYLSGLQGSIAKWAAWSAYWTVTGWIFTGIWICGHEAGHRAFSTSTKVNDAWGLVLHTFVLVPYHAWRISHGKHHAATGHMTRDEVFVPATRSSKQDKATGRKVTVAPGIDLDELLEDAPAYRLFWLLVQQLFGWPAYLFANASGQPWYPKGTNHFFPSSPVFEPRHFNQIIISDVALAVMGFALYKFGQFMGGPGEVVKYYGIPYLAVNHWLVMITYLQHTDPNLPHYRAGEWTFARGALCTMDRNMLGPVGPYLMHGITETHICHHLVSKIPHYHAWEATEALKELLGEHYSSTDENMFVSLWKNWKSCRFVEDEGEVVFYRDALGRTARHPVTETAVSDSGVDLASDN